MATFVTSKTFTAGDYLTFTDLNTAIGDGGMLHWLRNALHAIGIDADSGAQTVDSAMVGCRLSGSAQQIDDSVWTEVQFSTQRWGRYNGQDLSFLNSDRPTFLHLPILDAAPGASPFDAMAGYWMIGGHVSFAGNTTGVRGVRIVSHGNKVDLTNARVLAEKFLQATGAGAVMNLSISTVDAFNAGGGSYSLQVYQNSGDSLQLQQITNSSPELWAVKLAKNVTDVS